MTFQFLPNYFRKIGIFIFVVAGIPAMKKGYIEGYNAASGMQNPETFEAFRVFGLLITEQVYHTLSIIGVLGLLMYLFSKEKLMDEYLVRLRLESVQITFIMTALFVFGALLINREWTVSAIGLIEYQLVLFIIVSSIKKLKNRPGLEAEYE